MALSTRTQAGVDTVIDLLKDDTELVALIGTCVYAGVVRIAHKPDGIHFYFHAPNSRTAQGLIDRAIFLFVKLHEVFPISRLLISTTADPFQTVAFDNWINLGVYEITPDLLLGLGTVEGHPDWHAVVKLDEDGRITR
jgi:hypothetical protein